MAICAWCREEMRTAISCTLGAVHRRGRHFEMIPYGDEHDWPSTSDRCGDCGCFRGGWHHPGCDIQQCPACGGQLLSCGCRFDEDGPGRRARRPIVEPLGVDGNGLLTERMWLGDQEVIIHRDEVPESDITTVQGIRCTTALRTVIDMAPEISTSELEDMLRQSFERKLFTVEEAWRRLGEADMVGRRGAELLATGAPTLGGLTCGERQAPTRSMMIAGAMPPAAHMVTRP